MKKMIFIGLFIILMVLLLGFWIYGFLQANDLSVPSRKISSLTDFKKILLVFPHADDEVQSSAGLLTLLAKSGAEVDWLLLTKGEKGTPDASQWENLKSIRIAESQSAAKIYGISNPIQKDFPDGGVSDHKSEITTYLRELLTEKYPGLVITYDPSGLYGHPDHIATSEMVTEILKSDFPNIGLWYVSFPQKFLDQLKLPEQMANDPNFKKQRKYPNFKVWVGVGGVIDKIKAVYSYQSQFQGFTEGLPIPQIPLWFYITLTPYEYFYEVK